MEGRTPAVEQPTVKESWDVFLAYASPDREMAESLYGCLVERCRVFWDQRGALPGRAFGSVLEQAQRGSRMTVALIRRITYDQAHYLRDEVHRAIDLTRTSQHRLVPVRLDREPPPYGLAEISWLDGRDTEALGAACEKLCEMLCVEPRFRATGDVKAVVRLLDELFPAYHQALSLWLGLRDLIDGHALGRRPEERWREVLRAFLDRHPRGLVPVLEAAWRAAPEHGPFGPFLLHGPAREP
jgi:hypothetical protein